MTTNTLRPNATTIAGDAAFTGGATWQAVTADDSDATWAELGTEALLEAGTFTLDAGNVTKQIRVRARVRSVTGSVPFNVGVDCPNLFPISGVASVSGTATTTITTFTGAWQPIGLTQSDIDVLQFNPAVNGAVDVRFLELYIDVVEVSQPTVTIVAPTGTVTTSNTTATISYTAGSDGGAKTHHHLKVFTDAVFDGGGFNPETSASILDTGEFASSSSSIPFGIVTDGTDHHLHVKVAQTINGAKHWSAWDEQIFTVDTNGPDVASIVLTPNDATGAVEVVVNRDTGGAAWDHVTVERSQDGGTTWEFVRGASNDTASGNSYTVVDYEVPNGVAVVYRARGVLTTQVGAWASHGVVTLPGTTGNYLSAPDEAALDIVGDITVVARIAPNDWTPVGDNIVSKFTTAGNQRSWSLVLLNSGTLRFEWSTDGTTGTLLQKLSTVTLSSLANGEVKWVAVTLDVNNGASGNDVRFWTGDDGVTWSQLGATVTTAGVTSIHSGTAGLNVGAINAGTGNNFAGKVYAVSVRSGIGALGVVGGSEVFGFDADDIPVDDTATSFVAGTGQTVTINRSGSPDTVVGYVADAVEWESDDVWLKSLTDPAASMTVALQAIPDYTLGETQTQTVGLQTETTVAADELEALLGSIRQVGVFHVLGAEHPTTVFDAGEVLLIQWPASYGLTDAYLTVTTYGRGFVAPQGQQTVQNIVLRSWAVETVTVGRPPDTSSA